MHLSRSNDDHPVTHCNSIELILRQPLIRGWGMDVTVAQREAARIDEKAARQEITIAGGKLSAALFYGEDSGEGNIDSRYGGSASYLFSQGTNITGHYTENEPDNATSDADSWSLKLGHKWGPHAVSIGYGEAEDVVVGFEDQGWNIGYVHNLKKANTQLYASFNHHELDTPTGTASVEDISAFVVGARVKFD